MAHLIFYIDRNKQKLVTMKSKSLIVLLLFGISIPFGFFFTFNSKVKGVLLSIQVMFWITFSLLFFCCLILSVFSFSFWLSFFNQNGSRPTLIRSENML